MVEGWKTWDGGRFPIDTPEIAELVIDRGTNSECLGSYMFQERFSCFSSGDYLKF